MPLLLFVVLPLAELWLLIRVGAAIGALTVVAWVVAAAALGVAVIQRQGINTLTQVRARLARGEPPAEAMLDGMLLALSGLLLVVPGLLTDVAGLLGLVPTLRHWLVRRLLASPRVVRRGGGNLIEGDYERED
ncbi:MAG: FxsA family protein [Pseudomonadales bacterium]|nr:FxsA family protein [Pseudomonadales bacterium]